MLDFTPLGSAWGAPPVATPTEAAPPASDDWCARPALLDALAAAGSERRRRELVQDELATLGFHELGFGRVDTSRGTPMVAAFCGLYAQRAWVQRYFSRRYPDVDPRLRAIERTSLPCVWTLQSLARQAVGPQHAAQLRAFVDDLADRDVAGGLMLALPSMPGQPRRFISLISRGAVAPVLNDAGLGRVLTLALCLEEFHGSLPGAGGAADDDAPAGALSPMQAQILDLLSRGMGDKQIAARLDMSRHNVDYHLRRLRKRFGARNRVQLMQAALGSAGLS